MARRMTVVGCGYLGATHAACMAELGFEVLGLDVDESRVEALQPARPPFYEPGLEPLLRKHVESGRLRFTTSFAEAAEFGDVHFLCVSTPQREGELAVQPARRRVHRCHSAFVQKAMSIATPIVRGCNGEIDRKLGWFNPSAIVERAISPLLSNRLRA